jgi:hypothetical protein
LVKILVASYTAPAVYGTASSIKHAWPNFLCHHAVIIRVLPEVNLIFT